MNTNIIRKHFFFKGRVQGVGFRYRAQNAASLYSVTGWVKNLYDGSVEMEAQGTEEEENAENGEEPEYEDDDPDDDEN